MVASALGHGAFAITARHYIEPSALANTQLRKVSAALSGTESIDVQDVSALLQNLPSEQLAAILRSIADRN